jgi:hypothetical protein
MSYNIDKYFFSFDSLGYENFMLLSLVAGSERKNFRGISMEMEADREEEVEDRV